MPRPGQRGPPWRHGKSPGTRARPWGPFAISSWAASATFSYNDPTSLGFCFTSFSGETDPILTSAKCTVLNPAALGGSWVSSAASPGLASAIKAEQPFLLLKRGPGGRAVRQPGSARMHRHLGPHGAPGPAGRTDLNREPECKEEPRGAAGNSQRSRAHPTAVSAAPPAEAKRRKCAWKIMTTAWWPHTMATERFSKFQ